MVAGIYELNTDFDPEREQISEFSSEAIEDHENFDGFHYDNDIALIFLSKPLNFTRYVKNIRLVNPDRRYRNINGNFKI